MNAQARLRLGKGVRLRREQDGSAMLLVPEGALVLNPSAAATLELVDGERSLADIAKLLVARFEVDEEQARQDVRELLERLAQRRLIVEAS